MRAAREPESLGEVLALIEDRERKRRALLRAAGPGEPLAEGCGGLDRELEMLYARKRAILAAISRGDYVPVRPKRQRVSGRVGMVSRHGP